jgi:hypothetical protein
MIIYLWAGFQLCYALNTETKEFIKDPETGKAVVFDMEYCKE